MNDPKFLDVKGIKTRYFENGTGEPLVLIHGGHYGSYYSSYCWSLNIDELAEHFHVFALDKLGMGFTENPPTDRDYTMAATIEHAFNFISVLGLERVNLVGHSRGGFVAARISIEHPNVVRTLCIIDSNTLAADDPSTPKDFYQKIEDNAPIVQTSESVQAEAKANSYSTFHITEDFVLEMLQISKSPRLMEAKEKMKTLTSTTFLPNLAKMKEETLERIRKGDLKTPTLIVWGYNDPSAPVKLAFSLYELIAKSNERTQLHILNKAGHYCYREHSKDFDQLLTLFIKLS